ncbi:MAG: DUF4339 domain-containing protein [Pirellulaceae bacterium]
MGIKFLCPNGHKMNVKAFLAGKRGKCPKCGASVRIPQETPASDSGEDLLGDAGEPSAAVQTAVSVAPAVATAPAAPYSAPMVRAVLPAGAPAIPSVPVMTPGYQPAGPAVMRAVQPISAPMGVDPISQAPNSIWYVRPPSGGQYGPARGDIMRKWVSEGRVSGDSLVWREGFPEWKTAGQLFPSLAGVGAPATAAGPPPPPAETADVPKVTRALRKLNAYEARKSKGTGMAIAILVILGIICVALVIGLAVVLSQGTGGSPKKSAAMTFSTRVVSPAPLGPGRQGL